MQYFLIIILLIFALVIILLLWQKGIKKKNNICAVAENRKNEKDKKKDSIIAKLKEKERLSNKEIRNILKISERSVVRYMEELEKEGIVRQVGKTGRSTYYSLK